MTDEQKLKLVIEKAIITGWDLFGWKEEEYKFKWKVEEIKQDYYPAVVGKNLPVVMRLMLNGTIWRTYTIRDIFFDHDFAKAYWGEQKIEIDAIDWIVSTSAITDKRIPLKGYKAISWRFHLQQAVISDSPLNYYFERL